MPEYIEREKIALTDFEIAMCKGSYKELCQMLLDKIKSIPAADVRPVVPGRWRFEEGDGETCVDGWVCSACGCGFHTHVPYFEDFNFCPNCGADMKTGAE